MKKLLSLLLALCLCFSLLPAAAFADEGDAAEPHEDGELADVQDGEDTGAPDVGEDDDAGDLSDEDGNESELPGVAEGEEPSDPADAEGGADEPSEEEPAEVVTQEEEPGSVPGEEEEDEPLSDGEEDAKGAKNAPTRDDDRAVTASGTCGAQGDNLSWTLYEDGELVIEGEGAMAEFGYCGAPWYGSFSEEIHSATIGDGVSSIGSYAFYECCNLNSVTISDGVTSIGEYAFNNCRFLGSITLPSSLTSIGNYAFKSCSSLTSVAIPAGVTSIGNYAFYYCWSLTSITIPEGVTSLSDGIFENCSNLSSVALPSTLTSIGSSAFYCCNKLTSVTFPSTLTSIGSSAFYCCDKLTSVTFPSTLTSIGSSAFNSCSMLADIAIPASVTAIGSQAFAFCPCMKKVSFAHSAADELTISSDAFQIYDGPLNTTVFVPDPENMNGAISGYSWSDYGRYVQYCAIGTEIPADQTVDGVIYRYDPITNEYEASGHAEGLSGHLTILTELDGYPVTSIGMRAFENCSNLTRITIPESVTSIGSYAFYNCDDLSYITIPESVTSIGSYAFYSCQYLTSVAIPSSVTSIGSYAFSYCYRLTSITIPEGVTSLSNGIFSNCSNLTSVALPSSLTSIGSNAFNYCFLLPCVTIPESVTSIGSNAFYYCNKLTSVTLPTNLKSIGYGAFGACGCLASVTIPSSVTSIGSEAFENCPSLKKISFAHHAGDDLTIAYDAFRFGNGLLNTAVFVPDPENMNGAISGYSWTDYGRRVQYYAIGTELPSDRTVDGVFYSFDPLENAYEASGQTDVLSGQLTILAEIDGYPVTSIGNNAFKDCDRLTSVTIPSSVTSIGSYAFNSCDDLSYITIPENVTSIGSYAFQSCNKLSSVILPSGLTSISSGLFCYCENLTYITVPENVTSIGDSAFYYCTSLASVRIPAAVKMISSDAFLNCGNLKRITFAHSMSDELSINSNAFSSYYGDAINTALLVPDTANIHSAISGYNWAGGGRTVQYYGIGADMPEDKTADGVLYIFDPVANAYAAAGHNSELGSQLVILAEIDSRPVTAIGSRAFQNCSYLNTVTIPASITSIGSNAFYNCSSLRKLNYGGTLEQWQNISISEGNDAITNAEFSFDGELGDDVVAFGFCGAQGNNLSWTLYDTGELLISGTGAMKDFERGNAPWLRFSNRLFSVVIQEGVTTVSRNSFVDCEQLTSVSLPDSITSLGSWSFNNTGIVSIFIPANVSFIDAAAFYWTQALQRIDVAEDNLVYKSDEYGVVYSKDGTVLEQYPDARTGSYEIPEGVTTVAEEAFYSSSGVSSLQLPSTLTTIGRRAFYNVGISSILIPASVSVIEDGAFSACHNLVRFSVEEGGAFASDEQGALYTADMTVLLQVPGGYSGAFTIPTGVKTIQNSAFHGISGGISTLYIPASVESFDGFDSYDYIGEIIVEPGSPLYTSGEDGVIYNKDMTEIVRIPDSVTGVYTIPDSISTFSGVCISENTGITQLVIPASVTTVYGYWYKLAYIRDGFLVDEDNPNYSNDEKGVLFNKNKTVLYCVPCQMTGSYSIPEGVNQIVYNAFYGSNLSSVRIPVSVRDIGNAAFCGYINSFSFAHTSLDPLQLGNDAFYKWGQGKTLICVPDVNDIHPALLNYDWAGHGYSSVRWREYSGDLPAISGEMNGMLYELDPVEGGIVITGCTSELPSVLEIPETIEGYPVTTIGEDAFRNTNGQLQKVVLPASIRTIEQNAFLWSYLNEIELPEGLEFIGREAFEGCRITGEFYIPASLTEIGSYAFANTRISAFRVSEDNSVYSSDEQGLLYNKRKTTLLQVPPNYSGELSIPEGVTAIDWGALSSSSGITVLHIPTSLTSVPDGYNLYVQKFVVDSDNPAFSTDSRGVLFSKDKTVLYCVPKSISGTYTIPSSVTTVKSGAFSPSAVTSIAVPAGVVSMEYPNTSTLERFSVSADNPVFSSDSYGILFNKDKTQLISFPRAFPLDSYSIPDSVRSLENCDIYAPSLRSLTIPASLSSIGRYTISCGNLRQLRFLHESSDTLSIASNAFYYGGGTSNRLTVCVPDPDNIHAALKDYAWESNSLQVTFAPLDTPLIIGTYKGLRYEYDAGLEGLVITGYTADLAAETAIPGSIRGYAVRAIGSSAFQSCKVLTSITLPEGLTMIESYAFLWCQNLKKLSLPGSLKTIGMYAFYGCSALNNVSYSGSSVYWNQIEIGENNEPLLSSGIHYLAKPVITQQPESVAAHVDDRVIFTIAATDAESYQWSYQKPGTSTWTNVSSGGTSASYTLSAAALRHNGYKYRCTVKNASGSVTSATATLSVTEILRITTQPKDVRVKEGGTASFTVKATGVSKYQWYYRAPGASGWTAVSSSSGKTASYSMTVAARHNGNQYRCALTGAEETIYTDVVTLTLLPKPTITSQPQSITVFDGDTATFTVEADDAASYQWSYQKPGTSTWTDVSAASGKTATYTMTAAARHNGYKYRCTVKNAAGSTVSSAAKLTVRVPIVITVQPKNLTVNEGATATFKVTATGADSFLWYYQKPGETDWTSVSSSSGKTASYSMTTAARHDGYKYRCELKNATESVVTDAVTLTLNLKPVITQQPESLSIYAGYTASFTVVADGAAGYQWSYQKPGETTWTNVSSNGTSETYSLTAAARHNGYKYRCTVKNSVGSRVSATATLTVMTPIVITTQPVDKSVAAGKSVTFKVTATGASSYQWYYQKPGETTWTAVSASSGKKAAYTMTAAARHDGYKYRCLLKNATTSVYTDAVTLTVW